jgi:hypothetical protein
MSVNAIVDVWQHAPDTLTSSDILVLLVIADSTNDLYRVSWESVPTMMKKARLSERQVYQSLKNLEALNIIRNAPDDKCPPISQKYRSVVREMREPGLWTQSAKSENTLNDLYQDLREGDDAEHLVTTAVTLQNLHPAGAAPNPVSLKINPKASRMDFVHTTDGAEHDIVTTLQPGGRGKRNKAITEPTDERTEMVAGIYVPEEKIRAEQIRRGKVRADPQPDTGNGLELYFRRAYATNKAGWSDGLATTNQRVLAGTFNEWMLGGMTPDTIRTMIDIFVEHPTYRNDSIVPWKDFLSKRFMLGNEKDYRDEKEAKAGVWDRSG